MPEWLIDLYKAAGFGILFTILLGALAVFWYWVSSGAWWGLAALFGTLLILGLGVPTLLWVLGVLK